MSEHAEEESTHFIDSSNNTSNSTEPVNHPPDEPTVAMVRFKNPLEPIDRSLSPESLNRLNDFRHRISHVGYVIPSVRVSLDNGKRYECKLCGKIMRSRYQHYVHVRKHSPECFHCFMDFDSWKEFKRHIPVCPRRKGIIRIPRRLPQNLKPKKRPFKCQLCNRRYTDHSHLYNHQVQRCEKRYVADSWIVKI